MLTKIFNHIFYQLEEFDHKIQYVSKDTGYVYVFKNRKHVASLYFQAYKKQDRLDIFVQSGVSEVSTSKYFSCVNTCLSFPDYSLICKKISSAILYYIQQYDQSLSYLNQNLKLNADQLTLFEISDLDTSKIKIDFTDYYTKEELSKLLKEKADKNDIINLVNKEIDLSNFYTKAEIDKYLNKKADLSNIQEQILKVIDIQSYYTKDQLIEFLDSKISIDNIYQAITEHTYAKQQILALLELKATYKDLEDLIKIVLNNYYDKDSIFTLLNNKVKTTQLENKLSEYTYSKTQIADILNNVVTYTQVAELISNILAEKHYTKDQTNQLLQQKITTNTANELISAFTYSTEEIETKLSSYINHNECLNVVRQNSYSKEQIDERVTANVQEIQHLLSSVNDKNAYTKKEIDILLSNKVDVNNALNIIKEITYSKQQIDSLINSIKRS